MTEPVNRYSITAVRQSFRGSHVFEAVGLSRELIDEFFPGTVSRVGGLGLDGVARERLLIFDTEADSEVLR